MVRWLPGPFGWLILLILGFVCSVLIAWVGEIVNTPRIPPTSRPLVQSELIWPDVALEHWPGPDKGSHRKFLLTDSTWYASEIEPDWVSVLSARYNAWTKTAGFPFRCLWSIRVGYDSDPSIDFPGRTVFYIYHIGAFEMNWRWLIRRLGYHSWLSFRIKPLGMMANTLIYAALLWMPILLARQFRNRRRIAANRCARCGYDVETLDQCPECGLKVEQRNPNPSPAIAMAGEPQ